MSHVMKKPVFFVYANTKAQISCTVMLSLSAHFFSLHVHSTISQLDKSEMSSYACTARFVSDLVGNIEDCFPKMRLI